MINEFQQFRQNVHPNNNCETQSQQKKSLSRSKYWKKNMKPHEKPIHLILKVVQKIEITAKLKMKHLTVM